MSIISQATSLEPVLDLAERTLTVGHLVRNTTLYTVALEDDCSASHRRMTALNLDSAPIEENPIRRFVRRDQLSGRSGPVWEHAEPIDAPLLVASDLPLADLLEKLRQLDFVFVLDGDRVGGIVTRADLQSPLVGLFVLGLLVAAERALDELIARYTNDDWHSLISKRRFAQIVSIYETRQRSNTEVNLLACSNLYDRLTIAAKLPEVRNFLGWTSRNKANEASKIIKRVRDCLAHGDSLLAAVPDPITALASVATIRQLAERAWALVQTDDNLWDIYASTTLLAEIDGNSIALNGPGAAEWPWPEQEAWIVTAANPRSLSCGETRNARNNKALAEDIRSCCLVPVPAVGRNGSWLEQSWLVLSAPEDTILGLARAYGQRAVFRLDARLLRVIGCDTGETMAWRGRRRLLV